MKQEKNKREKQVKMTKPAGNTKTSYHLTGKCYKELINKELGAGKINKNHPTGSYLILPEIILPETKHLT
jgi:hypothetical protein